MTVSILCACGGASGKLLTVGETAHGKIIDITVTSVEYVNKIENGLEFYMWSPAERRDYQDVTAEAGYSIIKISYHVDYHGKESGRFTPSFEINYDDGYSFTTAISHANPKPEGGIGFEKKYAFSSNLGFDVDDPLSFTGEDAIAYIVVNDEVLTETEKSLVMNIAIPKTPDTLEDKAAGDLTVQEYVQGETETFTYDLRSVEFDLTSKPAEGDARYEKTGKVIGPNPHNPSLNEKYGNNSWDIKYGDNPVRELVFFRDDVDVNAYVGKEVTFSFIYGDNYAVDAYIVE